MGKRRGIYLFLVAVTLLAGKVAAITPTVTLSPTATPACTPAESYPRFSSLQSNMQVPLNTEFEVTFTTSDCPADPCVECRSYAHAELTFGNMLEGLDTRNSGAVVGPVGFSETRTFRFRAKSYGVTTVRLESRLPNYSTATTVVTAPAPTATPTLVPTSSPTRTVTPTASPTALPSPSGVAPGVLQGWDPLLGAGRASYEVVGIDERGSVGQYSVGLGDLDGDGLDDWGLFGNWNGENRMILLWGREGMAQPASFDWLDPLRDRAIPFVTLGGSVSNYASAVVPAGDVDGDGYDDVLFTPNQWPNRTTATIFFGAERTELQARRWRQLLLTGGPNYFGRNVAAAGDVNGDGADDIAFADGQTAYLLLGGNCLPTTGTLSLASGCAQLYAFKPPADAYMGVAPVQPGDVDGDGYDDLLFTGIFTGLPTAGAITTPALAMVLYGGLQLPADHLFPAAAYASARCTFFHYKSSVNFSKSGAGDVNGDGFADLLMNDSRMAPSGWWQPQPPGQVVVYHGGPSLPRHVDVQKAKAPEARVLVGPYSGSEFGYLATPASDVNGDGFDDLWIFGRHAVLGSTAGRWLVYGSAAPLGTDGIWDIGTATAEQARLYAGGSYYAEGGPAPVGDVNGDGMIDTAFGDPDYTRSVSGGPTIYGRAIAAVSETSGTLPVLQESWTRPGVAAPRSRRIPGRETTSRAHAAVGFEDGHGPDGPASPSRQQVLAVPIPTPIAEIPALPVSQWDIDTTRENWTTATLQFSLRPAQVVPVEQGTLRLYRSSGAEGWTTMTMTLDPSGLDLEATSDRLGSFVVAGVARPFISPTATPTATLVPSGTPTSTVTPTPTEIPSPTYWPVGSCTPWLGYPSSFFFTTEPTIDVPLNQPFSVRYGSGSCYPCGVCCSGCVPGVPNLNWDSAQLTQVSAPPYSCNYDPYFYSICNEFVYRAIAPGTTVIRMVGPYADAQSSSTVTVNVFVPTPTVTPIGPLATPVQVSQIGTELPGVVLNLTGSSVSSVEAAGDLNRDGYSDVMLSESSLFVAMGRAETGSFAEPPGTGTLSIRRLATNPSTTRASAGGDADGDGYPDLLLSNYGTMWLTTGAAAKLAEVPAPTIALTPSATVGQITLNLYASGSQWFGDLDGDGRDDYGLFSSSTLGVIRGRSPAVFPANPLALTTSNQTTIWWPTVTSGTVWGSGDFDGNGYRDIIATYGNFAVVSLRGGVIQTALFDPAKRVSFGENGTGTTNPFPVPVGDVNGDGRTDIVMGQSAKSYGWLSGSGTATLIFGSAEYGRGNTYDINALPSRAAVLFVGQEESLEVGRIVSALSDVNGDGLDDFFLGTARDKGYVIYGREDWSTVRRPVALSELTPDLGFRLEGLQLRDAGIAGDFNGDGAIDSWYFSADGTKLYILHAKVGVARKPQRTLLPNGFVTRRWAGDENSAVEVGFDNGTAPPGGTGSTVSALLQPRAPRTTPGLEPRYWLLGTDRADWTSGTVVFHDVEVPQGAQKGLAGTPRLLFTTSFGGQWNAIPATWDPVRRTLTAQVTQLGYFAIGTVDTLPALPDGFVVM